MTTAQRATSNPGALADIVSRLANRPQDWMHRVRLDVGQRWYERLEVTDDYDVWLLSWLPEQRTGYHDHRGSAGAFVVAIGSLEEQRPGQPPLTLQARAARPFGPGYVHDVRNVSSAPAVSLHLYAPPLTDMTHYTLDSSGLRPLPPPERREAFTDARDASRRRSVDDVLTAARRRFARLAPRQAQAAAREPGSVLVDIRPLVQRARDGTIPDALTVERNVLEWRFDPASPSRLPAVDNYDVRPILVCSEGYASSFAAASLQDIGLWRATDVIGGFQAWREAGLPTASLAGIAPPAFETRREGQR